MTDGQVQKTCVICGEDCSGRPRIKNARGQYACRSCYEARAASKAPAPAQSEQDSEDYGLAGVLDGLADGGAAEPVVPRNAACPACNLPVAAGQAICTSCGCDLRSGKVAKTKVGRNKPARQMPSFLSSPWLIIIVGVAFGLVYAGVVTGGSAALLLPFVLMSIVYAIFFLGTWLMAFVLAFKDGNNFWGIFLIICPCIPYIGLAAATYYLFMIGGRPRLGACYAVILIMGLIGLMIQESLQGMVDSG